ncbi:MAG TPA: aspartate-semialdehyde dehydrogenase [Myxococcales bacterium]|nr:aspartate-semialdehyde dehydrogenase [Myxococcales bacterium]
MKKLDVAVVGATGLAGQQFLASLADHPWFRVTRVAASERSAGKPLREALTDKAGAFRWYAEGSLSPELAKLPVEDAAKMSTEGLACVFSAIESEPARELEPRWAREVPVVSTASAFRYEPDVPVLIPPVNPAHVGLLEVQRRQRGWKGYVTPNPNCTTTGLAITLKPLADAFGLKAVLMTSLQACSGAGRSPGVVALDILDNVIPFISGEEEKVQKETAKILGALEGEGIAPHAAKVSCTCTRVAVLEGHTESVFLSLGRAASLQDVRGALESFGQDGPASRLPSAPKRWIEVRDDPYRPQPRLDRDAGGGMTTVVGRLRLDPVLENGVKLVLLSHNTKMGAAKGAILTAELLRERGQLG